MSDLFDSLDETKRQRLRARGWKMHVTSYGRHLWQSPNSEALFDEPEAFRQLARLEVEEGA